MVVAGTEYVSKELYHAVCADLRCGWSRTLRRLLRRCVLIGAYVVFVFTGLATINQLVCGSGTLLLLLGALASAGLYQT